MSMDLGAPAPAASASNPDPGAADAPFEVISESHCGLEVRHLDGAIFAFMLNPAHTGLVECRRP